MCARLGTSVIVGLQLRGRSRPLMAESRPKASSRSVCEAGVKPGGVKAEARPAAARMASDLETMFAVDVY